jgi:hypothetical protein
LAAQVLALSVAKFATAANARWIKTDSVAGPDVAHLGADLGDYTRAVAP